MSFRFRCTAITEQLVDHDERAWIVVLQPVPEHSGPRLLYGGDDTIRLVIYDETMRSRFTVGTLYRADFRPLED